jgi:hypothetical protein
VDLLVELLGDSKLPAEFHSALSLHIVSLPLLEPLAQEPRLKKVTRALIASGSPASIDVVSQFLLMVSEDRKRHCLKSMPLLFCSMQKHITLKCFPHPVIMLCCLHCIITQPGPSEDIVKVEKALLLIRGSNCRSLIPYGKLLIR